MSLKVFFLMPANLKPSVDEKNRIQSYQRMLDVLQCFSPVARHLTVSQVSEGSSLPRPTVHRILNALKDIGFIEQDVQGGGYRLGIGLYELGSLALSNMDLHREATPFVESLARNASAAVHLGVFNGESVVLIERERFDESRQALSARVEIAPIHCTGIGKAVGAFLPKDVVKNIAQRGLRSYTSHTLSTLSALEREYVKVRKLGYAFDEEELQLFVRCVAAPIRNASGKVFAAISVSGPLDRMTKERQQELASVVMDTAGAISRHLGYVENTKS
jgi:DNA-binding IclR family transcriptional regulator